MSVAMTTVLRVDGFLDDRPSNSTLEDLSRPDLKSKDISDPDEDVIRNKIQEANQLIDRVKKALSKIKAIKSCDNYEPGKSRDNKSSSTDIEDTIKNLKEETDQLIIGDTEEQCFETDAEKPKFRSCCPIGSVPPKQTRKNSSQENKEDHISVSSPLNRSLVRECKEKRCTAASDEEPKSVNDAETFEYLDNSDNGAACQYYDKYGARRCNIDLERPKTRRNEADDDLTEQLRKDKFRSCPESGHLEVTSSFEELQEKLQTISESTESSYSTPRKKQKDASADQHCKCCGTEQPETENIEIQICPDTITSGVGCDCLSEDKSLQATILRPLTKKVTIESLSPKRKSLEITNLRPQKIGSGNRNCSRCKVESLPVLELRSEPEQRVCHKCKMELKEEHLDGVSIPPKLNKLQKLTIKVLPPIIIQQAMTITKVLNLSINPQGETENRIENTHNIVFVDVKTLKVAPIVEDFDKERTLNYLSDDVQELSINRLSLDENMKSENEHRANADNSDPCNKSEGTLRKEINADNDFVLSEKEYEDGISRLTSDEEEELRKKMLWYKSFHIYDNPNRHDPGKLDQMSMEKISQIDINFYKTFIDPNAILSQEYFSPSTSRYTGFESKMVQCNESMLMDPDKRSNKAEASKNYNKSLFLDLKNASGNEDMESQVTVLRTHGDHLTTPGHPPEPKSSPSEITVTISYTLSSEGGSPVKTRSEIQESEVAATNLDLQSQDLDEGGSMKRQPQTKVLTLADKAVLNKLREKLKSVDTTASIPMYTLTRDSANGETIDNFLKGLTAFEETENTHSLTNRKPKSKGKDHTVNYLFKDETTPLDSSYRKHLELGKNGRYMDEENMFTQLPHPTVANMSKSTKVPHQSIEFKDAKPYSFEHKDKEVTKNKFKTIPRHRLKRYSPDTSNSDTVTTNSISEGEIRCKHSVSNGEIHICRHSPQCPRMRRNVLTRKNVAFSQTHRSPHSVACSVPKKFDVNDSKVTIEQRRNYFNNWVTYYVRTQDVHETSTTSCSNNKQ